MIGKQISHYKILEQLGAGGMGVVYKALDTKLNRNVAVKFLPKALSFNPDIKQRFKIEAQSAAALNHPNIATIHATEEAGDNTFIVMEYIEGHELKDIIAEGSLEITKALDIAIQVAQGLNEAHTAGIIHRDIKSANVMITKSGLVKVMDFGLAKLSGSSMITQMGTTLGTINYMSPEQSRGEEVDHRTDLWSLGVILYEMLTGKLPFKGDYEQAVIYSIMNEPAKQLDIHDAPPELQQVMDRLLKKNPEERYQSAGELAKDLKKIKTSIETGVPIDLIDSRDGITKYVSQISAISSVSIKRRKVVPVASSIVGLLLLLLALFKGNELLNVVGLGRLSGDMHIAILPFTNIGSDSTNQAFVDGLMETLTNKVSQLEQFEDKLWVVPASEVRKASISSAGEAHKQFGVNLVISGSVEHQEKGYRVNINLIDAETMRQKESREINDPMTSTSFIQDEAIIRVADMLNLELKPESLKKLTAGSTDNPAAYELYLKGRGRLLDYDKAENVIAAVDYFENAIRLDSNFALAYSGLGEAYLERYQDTKDVKLIEKAIIYCNRAVDINESLTAVQITLGRIYYEQGKYQEALSEFQKVLQVDQKNTDAYRERAKAYLSLGNIEEAELSYKEAIRVKPDYWKGYNYLGVFYFQQGRYEDAAAQFQHVVTLNPNNAKGYRNLGAVYGILTKYDKAITELKHSLEIEPDYRTYNNLATIYGNEGKFKEAAQAYEKVLELRDTDYRVWGYLADAYYRAGYEKDKSDSANFMAISLAEEQLNLNPNDPELYCQLAAYYGMIGKKDESAEYLKKAENLNPQDNYVLITIGETYEEWLDERDIAVNWIKKALLKGFPVNELKNRVALRELLKDRRIISFVDSILSTKDK